LDKAVQVPSAAARPGNHNAQTANIPEIMFFGFIANLTNRI
jgi:hypothetical protein